jgi:hypothetical protein
MASTFPVPTERQRLQRMLDMARIRFLAAKTPMARRFRWDIVERLRARLAQLPKGA